MLSGRARNPDRRTETAKLIGSHAREQQARRTGRDFVLKDLLEKPSTQQRQRAEITSAQIARISNPSKWSRDSSRVNFNTSKLSSEVGNWDDELTEHHDRSMKSSHGLQRKKPVLEKERSSQPKQESQRR